MIFSVPDGTSRFCRLLGSILGHELGPLSWGTVIPALCQSQITLPLSALTFTQSNLDLMFHPECISGVLLYQDN